MHKNVYLSIISETQRPSLALDNHLPPSTTQRLFDELHIRRVLGA